MKTNLGWIAVYPSSVRPFHPLGRLVRQYSVVDNEPVETPIASLGAWLDYKLDQNLPLLFMLDNKRVGINLVDGSICIDGKWMPAMPGTRPMKLIYYRVHRASANGGVGMQVWHHIGYECHDHRLIIQAPDDGNKPTIKIER